MEVIDRFFLFAGAKLRYVQLWWAAAKVAFNLIRSAGESSAKDQTISVSITVAGTKVSVSSVAELEPEPSFENIENVVNGMESESLAALEPPVLERHVLEHHGFIGSLQADSDLSSRYKEELDWSRKL